MRTPQIRAVVFDLDGLMVNTEEVFHMTGRELLRRRNKTPTKELYNAMMGRRATEAFQAMIDIMELSESIPELKVESEAIFDELLDHHLSPMPGLYELLQAIEDRQLPKAVATSSERKYLQELLGRRLNLLDRFHATLTAEDVSCGKPNPEIYLKAAQALNVDPAEMLVLEDSENGTKAAAAAGAHIISVPHQHSSHHNFQMAKGVASSLVDPMILNLLIS